MSQTIYTGSQQNYYVNGALDSTIILSQGQVPNVNDIIYDTSAGVEWRITVVGTLNEAGDTYTGMEFKEVVDEVNILPVLDAKGWEVNTDRSYANAGIGLGTTRTPSTTNDTMVMASISLTSTLLTAATVQVQVAGSVVAEISASTNIQMATFLVPANSSYELVTTSGTASLVYLKEISL